MPGAIAIRDLHVSYGANEVIKGVDLDVEPGSVTAIIGPSGCGKSTLLRCVNRLTDLTPGCSVRGDIRLDGEEILKMDPVLLRRRIGMVFQRPNPFPMSIKENVAYGVRAQGGFKGDLRAHAEQVLTTAAIWHEVKGRLGDPAMSLSLGQQQRLCIARALAVSPKVLLMDEPAASLDPRSTSELESSIVAMKGEYTVMIVTHDMREALQVSDYTAYMNEGKIVEFAETRKLFSQPAQEATRQYLREHMVAVG
jgi:phosphate transport system ATP-binding protein